MINNINSLVKFLGNFTDDKQIQPFCESLARDFYALLKTNIESNKYGFSLAPATMLARKRAGISGETPLIATGEYLSAIIIEKTFVGVRQGTHKSGLSYEELANILEYGRRDKDVPAFPVWRKTYEDFLPLMQQKMQDYFLTEENSY